MASEVRQRAIVAAASSTDQFNSHTAEDIQQKTTKIIQNAKQSTLRSWDQLDDWEKDNEYIYTGSRPLSNSYWESYKSCLAIHNETGNIYTHLLATAWMIVLPVVLYPYAKANYPTANKDDWIVFFLFFLGGASCFALSTSYHILSSHSKAVHDFCHQLDYLGIIIVTAGCLPPGLWYTFPCVDRKIRYVWIIVDLTAQVVAAVCVVFIRRFRTPTFRPIRGFVFSFMASSAFYPIIYAIYLHGWRQMDDQAGASRYVLTIVTYLVAVAIYATRIPEIFKPGNFDIWGHSHQIFHVLMAVGLTIHLSAFLKAFDYVHRLRPC